VIASEAAPLMPLINSSTISPMTGYMQTFDAQVPPASPQYIQASPLVTTSQISYAPIAYAAPATGTFATGTFATVA
jgi:hypothetical protein